MKVALDKLLKEEGKTEKFVIALAAMVKPDRGSENCSDLSFGASVIFLVDLGPRARLAVPALLARLKENPSGWQLVPRQAAAATALGAIRSEPDKVIPALIQAVGNSEEEKLVRSSAATALVAFGP